MAAARHGCRLARALCPRQLGLRAAQPRAGRFASSEAATPADLADLENTTAFTAPAPGRETAEAFKEAQSRTREQKLPGSR